MRRLAQTNVESLKAQAMAEVFRKNVDGPAVDVPDVNLATSDVPVIKFHSQTNRLPPNKTAKNKNILKLDATERNGKAVSFY